MLAEIAEKLLEDLNNHELKVVLVPAPDPQHTNHFIRAVEWENVPWYKQLFSELGYIHRPRFAAGLEKIRNNAPAQLVWDKIALEFCQRCLKEGFERYDCFEEPKIRVCEQCGKETCEWFGEQAVLCKCCLNEQLAENGKRDGDRSDQ
jgi:hypothetical protein